MNLKQLKQNADSINNNINEKLLQFNEKLTSSFSFQEVDSLDKSKSIPEVFSITKLSKRKKKIDSLKQHLILPEVTNHSFTIQNEN